MLYNIFSKSKPSSLSQNKLPEIIIDFREKNSFVPSELSKLGHEIHFKSLPISDYLVKDIAIERKTISDFKSSIINKRILTQLIEIKQYPKHFLIIEGPYEELFDNFQLKENAVRGFLLSTITEMQVPIIFSQNEKETASFISILSRKKSKPISFRPNKFQFSEKETLIYILEGFPNIGPTKAKKLIEKFHSLKNIFNASEEDLSTILGKRSKDFLDLLNKELT